MYVMSNALIVLISINIAFVLIFLIPRRADRAFIIQCLKLSSQVLILRYVGVLW